MIQRPIIYVKRITNLSDARYCAGMGADLLGFVVTPNHLDYVNPIQFKEIMGWVSGPRRVVEITDWESLDLQDIITNYGPDLIHLSGKAITGHELKGFPLILEADADTESVIQLKIRTDALAVEFIIISDKIESESLKIWKTLDYPLLISMNENPESLVAIQSRTGAAGFMLEGSHELKPGFKDYDHLSIILEALDS